MLQTACCIVVHWYFSHTNLNTFYLSSEGSNMTPAHHFPDFRLKTYAPLAFRYFRELFGIKPDDYLVSVDTQSNSCHHSDSAAFHWKFQLIWLQHFVMVRLLRCSEFQYSICKEPLIELSNPGASSSWFYLTSDDEFIIKTVQHKEAEFLQKLLPGYYMVRCSLKQKLSLHLHFYQTVTCKSDSSDLT